MSRKVIPKSPVVVGVPEMVPPALRVRPVGNPPELIDHVYPGVPPEAESAWEYPIP